MMLCDQDEDGAHIRGLLFNVFHSLWPTLFQMKGFVNSMVTPVIKAFHAGTKREIAFYKVADFDKWKDTQGTAPGWTFKYYKGLGTSTAEEAKEYFRKLQSCEYDYTGKPSDESIDLAFNKKRADDRKKWLMKFDRNKTLDYTAKHIPYEEFVHSDLIHFSNRDLERNIPNLCDGLKESLRKIMYACFKRKLTKREIRVAQLSGYISEITAYHHGETSLQEAIIGLAQDFVGSNNINLLMPNGQFGTRVQGGKDSASPRYIHTLLAPLALKIFREEDAPILHYLNDDGLQIEPEHYIPIIPLILINGGAGIGTGFSTEIPSYNPSDVVRMCRAVIAALQKLPNIESIGRSDLAGADHVIDKVALGNIQPWTLGFKGSLENHKKEGSFASRGVWKWLDDKTVEITELPIGTWTDNYKEFLLGMITDGSTILKDFENHYTDKHVRFILKIYEGKRAELEKGDHFEKEFKMVSTKKLGINNMHLYNAKGNIQKYNDPQHIVREWAKIRLLKYVERKDYLLAKMEADHMLISAKVRFIQDIIDERVHVMNRPNKDVENQLTTLKYPTLADILKKMPKDPSALPAEGTQEGGAEHENDDDVPESPNPTPKEDDSKKLKYAYLTSMPIHQLTKEKKEKLEREAKDLNMQIQSLKKKAVTTLWEEELTEFSTAWESYKSKYEDDMNAAAAAIKKGKK
jgi:DNA topoisomerase II